jgi:hypothetical protein
MILNDEQVQTLCLLLGCGDFHDPCAAESALRDAAKIGKAAWRQVITNYDEVEDLPEGAVVRDDAGVVLQKVGKFEDSRLYDTWAEMGYPETCRNESIDLPAIVIFCPPEKGA